jgi:hypothetical protein
MFSFLWFHINACIEISSLFQRIDTLIYLPSLSLFGSHKLIHQGQALHLHLYDGIIYIVFVVGRPFIARNFAFDSTELGLTYWIGTASESMICRW